METEKCKTQDFGYIVYTRTNYESGRRDSYEIELC